MISVGPLRVSDPTVARPKLVPEKKPLTLIEEPLVQGRQCCGTELPWDDPPTKEKFSPCISNSGPSKNPVIVIVPLVITIGSALAVVGVNAVTTSRVANRQRIFNIHNFLSGLWKGKLRE
jgi:hypothetical protein